jgi:multidrug efflux pump subunit AcrA (membrane-fusion protein)
MMTVPGKPHLFRPKRIDVHAACRVLAAALLCMAVPGCKQQKETPAEAEVIVQAARPEIASISELIEGDAILAPLAQAALSPKISAPVKKFYVQRGARVHAGQLLVALEDRDLQATALDNRGSYKAAQALYDDTMGARVPQETQKAELDLAQAKATLALDQSIVDSRKQLFEQGAVPGRDLDTAQATLVQAQAAYDSASKQLHLLESVSRASTVQATQGQLTSARGRYLNAQAQVSYSTLSSPIDGIVTDRPLFAGEMAPAGTPLITVMDTSALLAKVHFSQSVTQRMKIGDAASVRVPGVKEILPAKVSLISPALDPGSTTVEVWIRLNNPDGSLKVGTPVHIAVTGQTIPQAMQIPASGLLRGNDGGYNVMVIGSDGTAHRRAIQVGIQTPEKVQITAGLGPADIVISTGAFGLEDGIKVKIGSPEDDKTQGGS